MILMMSARWDALFGVTWLHFLCNMTMIEANLLTILKLVFCYSINRAYLQMMVWIQFFEVFMSGRKVANESGMRTVNCEKDYVVETIL